LDGVRWVELAGVIGPDDVGSTIARALSVIRVQGESTQEALTRSLTGKQLLLVVDNFEHVIEAAELVGELLSACERLKVLVTSREALDLRAEHRVLVSPLALPAVSERVSVAEIESTAATALFLDAARRRESGLAVTPAIAPVIAQICARLDGLPLALELAAARTEVYSTRTSTSPSSGPHCTTCVPGLRVRAQRWTFACPALSRIPLPPGCTQIAGNLSYGDLIKHRAE
jgi:predicted ATPase